MRGSAELPTGTVTFLFTDVEGSTRLLRAQGKAYAGLLERHRLIMSAAATEGTVFGSAGDALFIAFDDAAAALRAATQAQQALIEEQWPADAAVSVRMGVHTGVPEIYAGDYVGIDVHRVARICSAAHGRQVLVSAATHRLTADRFGLVDLGQHRLKDFDEQQHVYQLAIAGCPDRFPPPRTLGSRVVRLPNEATSIIGRQDEITELARLVESSKVVTLTGAGGSGKSKLATRVAWTIAPRVSGSVVFVPLAELNDAGQVPDAIAAAFGDSRAYGSWDEVAEGLGSQGTLLVLDNAEHLDGLGHDLAALTSRCPDVRLLVTSRSPVQIAGERVFTVDPLPIEDAYELLVERIRAYRHGFEANADDVRRLRTIASRLDGLPLAIELIAPRLRSLTAQDVIERLDRQLDLLSTRRGDLPERQRTMRGAIEWSYDMLDGPARHLLEAISVFPQPAPLSAVAHVAKVDEIDTIDAADQLVEASLVRLSEHDETRYWMLEPIRQYAIGELPEHATSELRHRQARWFAAEAERHERLDGDAARYLRRDRASLQAAVDFARSNSDADAAVAIVYWTGRLRMETEQLDSQWIEELLDAQPPQIDAQSVLLGLISVGRERSARDPTARLDRAVELAADLGTPARLADALLWRSREHRIHGDPDRAIADLNWALALEPLDAGQREWFQLSLASAYWEAGQRDDARSLHAAVIVTAKRSENQRVLVTALGDAAWLDLLSGDDAAALQRGNEAYDLATRLDIPSMVLGSAHTLALTQLCGGDPQAAAASLGRCVPVLRDYPGRFRPGAYLHLGAAIAAGLNRVADVPTLLGAATTEYLDPPEQLGSIRYTHLIEDAQAETPPATWNANLQAGASSTHDAALDVLEGLAIGN
ncbi:MAG: NB-ARC domain-containing protein [Gaiellales bacterium]